MRAEYCIVLPKELIHQIVFYMPESNIREEKWISKTFDQYTEERRKLALLAEIEFDKTEKEVKKQDKIKTKLLMQASKEGYVWRVRHLLVTDNAVLVNSRAQYFQWTALHWAAYMGRVNVCRFLVQHGADPNSEDRDCDRPLHFAAIFGHLAVVQFLLQNDAKVEAVNTLGRTALHRAVVYAHISSFEIAALLLAHAEKKGGRVGKKALLQVKNKLEKTAFQVAYSNQNWKMAAFLAKEGKKNNNKAKRPDSYF